MRANDVILLLRNKGTEQGLKEAVLRLAEEVEQIHLTIKEMAKAFTALAQVQTMLNGVADELDSRVKNMEIRDGNPESTRGMVG